MAVITGTNDGNSGFGVEGIGGNGNGVVGSNGAGSGVKPTPGWAAGVRGDNGHGVLALSHTGNGLHAEVNGNGTAAVGLNHAGGAGGTFSSASGNGAVGRNGKGSGHGSSFASGLWGDTDNGHGVLGTSATEDAVRGEAFGNGSALHGIAHAAGPAGYFEGNVVVTGDIQLANADCAEDFDVADVTSAEPGTVMVLNEAGALVPSFEPYDLRVVGVVSGAGPLRPALRLDRHQNDTGPRRPVALLGKTYCKVDADTAPIAVGDMLTSSAVPGHAMRAGDAARAFGTVIGKALRPLPSGRGLIPILIALQ